MNTDFRGKKSLFDNGSNNVGVIGLLNHLRGRIFNGNLLEDTTYMVYLDSDKYVMGPFPIVVKDKSEYGEGRYAYNHTTCNRIDDENLINLFDPCKTDFDDQ